MLAHKENVVLYVGLKLLYLIAQPCKRKPLPQLLVLVGLALICMFTSVYPHVSVRGKVNCTYIVRVRVRIRVRVRVRVCVLVRVPKERMIFFS